MTDTKLVDTSAWIEFLRGSAQGEEVKKQMQNAKLVTPSPCLCELYHWALREQQDVAEILLAVRQSSTIFEPTANEWVTAAHKKFELRPTRTKIGFFDTLLLSVQETFKATIITTDNDFRDLPDVVVL